MAGYTPTGFERKRFQEILDDKNEAQRTALGQDLNLDPRSPDGQISGLLSLSDDQLWQLLEYCVNATDPDNATDSTLSNLVKINFIERLAEAPTLLVMSNIGTPGVTIPAGQLVGETDGSLVARITEAFTFSEAGTADAVAELTVAGPVQAGAGEFEKINTPQADWFTTTNVSAGITGRNRETDAELRLRRVRSVGTNSQNMLDSMRGKLANLAGVTAVNVIQNRGDVEDANGLGPHSFEAIVAGGETNAIAQIIWTTFPFGIGIEGNTTGNAIDAQGALQVVPFTRPQQVLVDVEVNIKKRTGFPANGETRIKDAIVSYVNGGLVAGRGFYVGDTVVYTELYTPVNTVPNLELVSLKIARHGQPPLEANLPLTIREYSHFEVANITVNEVV